MTIDKFLLDFSDALEIDRSVVSIHAATVFKELECWDSMNALNLIAMVDERYQKSIGGDEIEHSKTIEDLWNRIR